MPAAYARTFGDVRLPGIFTDTPGKLAADGAATVQKPCAFGLHQLNIAWIAVGASMRFAVDRKSTRLNSSHLVISYAVFCLKKKKRKCEYVALRVLRCDSLHATA